MIVRTYEEDEITVHRVPLMLMGGLVAISLALTASVTFGLFERTSDPVELRAQAGTKAVVTRDLFFFDEADGSVRVEDAASGAEVGRYGVGQGGFVRSTVRSLVHQRRIRGIGAEAPFELVEWDNGNLTLRDATTGSNLELDYFGKANRKIFADMLEGAQ